jgi:ankyrin repeat protein
MADPKDTLRYKQMVAQLESLPAYKKEAALMQEIAGGSQWRMDAAMEAIDKGEYAWKEGYIYSMGAATLLKQAAMFGRLETMEKLCKRYGFEVEKGGFYLHEPVTIAFQVATLQGHLDVADYLHNSCNASADQRSDRDWIPSALGAALDEKDLSKVDYLVKRGGDAGDALRRAVSTPNADMKIIRHLVENCGADVNKAGEGFFTPFLQAVKYGHNEIAKYLIEKGATPQNDKSAGEAMYTAAYRNNVDMIRTMIGLGMKPDQRDFTQALFGKAYDAAKVILTEGGVDINSQQHGALVYAIRSLTPEAVTFCLNNGADVAGTLAEVKANTEWAGKEKDSWEDMCRKLEALSPKLAAPPAPKPPQP